MAGTLTNQQSTKAILNISLSEINSDPYKEVFDTRCVTVIVVEELCINASPAVRLPFRVVPSRPTIYCAVGSCCGNYW